MTKGQFRLLVVLTVVFGFLGGAVSNLVFHGAPASAAAPAPAVQDEVRAKKFVVVDDDGKTRASLGMSEGIPLLALYDVGGKPRVNLSLEPDGRPGLGLWDAAGKARAGLCLLADGSPGLGLCDAAGGLRAAVGCIGVTNRITGEAPNYPESTLTLYKATGEVLWQAPHE